MQMGGAGDVPGAARAAAVSLGSLNQGITNNGILAHAEVIIGAPNHHFLCSIGASVGSMRVVAGMPFQVRENAIASFRFDLVYGFLEKSFVIQHSLSLLLLHPYTIIIHAVRLIRAGKTN